jgi:hypothetical protein
MFFLKGFNDTRNLDVAKIGGKLGGFWPGCSAAGRAEVNWVYPTGTNRKVFWMGCTWIPRWISLISLWVCGGLCHCNHFLECFWLKVAAPCWNLLWIPADFPCSKSLRGFFVRTISRTLLIFGSPKKTFIHI